jgi:diguanylate cyclase (GGDEF)-like protein
MAETIGMTADNEALGRFLYDFRRALLRHRKVRMALLFAMRFPAAETAAFDGDAVPERLDFRAWLSEMPPTKVSDSRQYAQLLEEQTRLIALAAAAVAASRAGSLAAGPYTEMLHSMLRFDLLADRVASGITTAMIDLDKLTGLLNRAAMERDLSKAQAAARASGRLFTIAMIDADHFKQVNDTHGHGFGDLVLETLAERFVAGLRPRDQVYRYGGEEFLLLLPDTAPETAWPVLERLRTLASASEIGDGTTRVAMTVSLGATPLLPDEDLRAAIARADAALYRAKETGRNRTEIVAANQPSSTDARRTLMNDDVKSHDTTAQDSAAQRETTARYDRFVEMSRELFDKGQEKGREAWEGAMELAHRQMLAAGEFGAEQGEVFKRYLRRDLDQTRRDARQLGAEAKVALDPARLGAGALSSLAKLLQAAGGAMTAWSEKAEAALEYTTGEITTAGTLTCLACGQKVQLKSTGVVPPCPSCHATRYRKGY